MSHKWEPIDKTAWTVLGAPLTVYVCRRDGCDAIHGGRPHRGRCGKQCGNFYPSTGRVPACTGQKGSA